MFGGGGFLRCHGEFAAVHGHVPGTASLYLSAAQRAGVIAVAHAHTTVHGGRLVTRVVKSLLAKRIVKHADYLLACSESAAAGMFGSDALRMKPYQIMPNAIDVGSFAFDHATREEVRAELGIGQGLVVGHVGRFESVKNHKFLLRVFAELLALSGDSTLVLVGDGPLRSSMEAMAFSLGIANRVIFTGVRADVHRLLQGMDAFVFPSLYEGFGLALLEAQASGLKVYASMGVPQEALVTPEVQSLDLRSGARHWAEQVYAGASQHFERCDAGDLVAAAGYDVRSAACDLQDFYLELTDRSASNECSLQRKR